MSAKPNRPGRSSRVSSTRHGGRAKGAKHSGDRETNRAARHLLLFVLVLGLVVVGIQVLNTTRGPLAGARPLNAQGLRVSGEGRSDASHVVPAARFSHQRARSAYHLAAQIPATLNQLYCWCGCIERGMRSNLECFETTHASVCDVCMAGAEIAWEMKQRGITDPAKVQQVLDSRFGRPA